VYFLSCSDEIDVQMLIIPLLFSFFYFLPFLLLLNNNIPVALVFLVLGGVFPPVPLIPPYTCLVLSCFPFPNTPLAGEAF
jgi:hypothetical protein